MHIYVYTYCSELNEIIANMIILHSYSVIKIIHLSRYNTWRVLRDRTKRNRNNKEVQKVNICCRNFGFRSASFLLTKPLFFNNKYFKCKICFAMLSMHVVANCTFCLKAFFYTLCPSNWICLIELLSIV